MPHTVFDILASWDDDARVWVGTCDALPLATEAASLEDLYSAVCKIGPELADLNGHSPARFRIVTDPVTLTAAE